MAVGMAATWVSALVAKRADNLARLVAAHWDVKMAVQMAANLDSTMAAPWAMS